MKKNGITPISGKRNNDIPIKRVSILLVLALFVTISCNDNDGSSSGDSSKPACQLITQTITGTGKSDVLTYTYKFVFSFTYDDAGNQTAQLSTYDYKYSDGKSATSVSKSSYQYDDKGFQTRRLSQYNATDKDGKSTVQTGNEDFTYENGLLTKDAFTSTNDGKTTNYIFQYEYDDKSRVVKMTNSYDNSSTKIEYSGDVPSKITKTDAVGNTSSPFLEFNSKGLLIKSIEIYGGSTDEYHYEYDSDGSMTKQERYINSKPSSSSSYQYDTKENPNNYIYALTKGKPYVPSTQPRFSNKRNYTRTDYSAANAALTGFEVNSSSVYSYDYNTQNFPTGYTNQNLDKAGAQTSTSTSTFEYSNCK